MRESARDAGRPPDRAVPPQYPARPPRPMLASRTTAAPPPRSRGSPDDLATLAWLGDPLCTKEVVTGCTLRTREPCRSGVCEALCRTRTGDPFLTMAVPPSPRLFARGTKPLHSG